MLGAGAKQMFTPFTIGNLKLKNRIVMAPMTRMACIDNAHGSDAAPYYARRARGGVGLIIGEATCINHKAANAYENCPFFFGDEPLASWKIIVDAVHDAGAAFWPQLWHTGGVRQIGAEPDPSVPGYSPSGFIESGNITSIAMTKSDINEVVAAYGVAAAAAKSMGCDGLEINACHGYLIDEFFWSQTNQRSDEYGGTFENRSRFACDVVAAVRAAVGSKFPICLRISQWKHQDYTAKVAYKPNELEKWLAPLVTAGVDVFHCSTRRFWESEFDNSPLNLAGWVKKLTGTPTITVGSIGLDTAFVRDESGALSSYDDMTDAAQPASIEILQARLNREEFDLVAVGRALLADPDWPTKVREGRTDAHIAYSKTMLTTLV